MNLFFLTTMNTLGIKDNGITKKKLPLIGFNNSTMYPIRTMVLLVMVTGSIVMTNFLVIDVSAHNNAILEKP